MLYAEAPQPLVRFRLCLGLRAGVPLRLSSGRLAIRSGRGRLVRSGITEVVAREPRARVACPRGRLPDATCAPQQPFHSRDLPGMRRTRPRIASSRPSTNEWRAGGMATRLSKGAGHNSSAKMLPAHISRRSFVLGPLTVAGARAGRFDFPQRDCTICCHYVPLRDRMPG